MLQVLSCVEARANPGENRVIGARKAMNENKNTGQSEQNCDTGAKFQHLTEKCDSLSEQLLFYKAV